MAALIQYPAIKKITGAPVSAITCSVLALSFLFISSCSFSQKNKWSDVKKIYVKSLVPVVKLDGELIYYSDSSVVTYYGDIVLYQLPFEYVKIKVNEVEVDGQIELQDSVISEETKCFYFVVKQGLGNFGLAYNSLYDSTFYATYNKDSIIKSRVYPAFDIYSASQKNSKVKTYEHAATNSLVEVYKAPPDRDDGDTLYLYYDNRLTTVDFSLSKKLDSLHNSKLYRIKIISNEKISKAFNIKKPEWVFDIKMGALKAEDPDGVLEDFFKRAEAQLLKEAKKK